MGQIAQNGVNCVTQSGKAKSSKPVLDSQGAVEIKSDQVLRAVFLHLKRQNSADNVRR
jgi:hypothetical protein